MIDVSTVTKWSRSKGEMEEFYPGELSLVGRPANRRKYLLTKSQRGNKMDIEAILKSVDPDNEEAVRKALKSAGVEGEAAEAAIAINSLVSAFDEIDSGVLAGILGVESAPASEQTEDVDLEKSLADMPEAVRKSVESIRQENQELRTQVDGLAKGIVQRESERKLEKFRGEVSGLNHLSTDTDELAQTVKSVHDADPEAADLLLKALRSANEVAGEASGDLYKSVGSNGDGPGHTDTYDQAATELEKRARELVNKSDKDLSFADAQEQVLREDRELAKAYFQN